MSTSCLTREMNPVANGFGQVNLTGSAQSWATIAAAMFPGGVPPLARVLVSVSANAAVVRMDGTAVTNTTGHFLAAGYQQVWEGEWLRASSWINQGAGAAVLSIQILA